MTHFCVGLILYGDSPHALEVLSALKAQDLDDGTNLSVVIVDNGVPQTLKAEIFENFGGSILVLRNRENLGFCAAANQCLAEALRYEANYLLLLNPDLLLETLAVRELLRCAKKNPKATIITPKLFRANADLSPSSPPVLDACGMYMTNDLRHLDRGSNQLDLKQYEKEEEVFGASGACMLLNLQGITDLCLPRTNFDSALWKLYPQLKEGADERPQLFDEAFFAYREDADLAWRARIKGKKIIYTPTSIGHHLRRVTPEVRSELPKEINLWSVRNRFLMQLNNLRPWLLPLVFIRGFIFRNIVVVGAVLLKEKSSIPGLLDVVRLFKRALVQRRFVMKGVTALSYRKIRKYFI